MKKYVVSIILLAALVVPETLFAQDNSESTQTINMSVGGAALIKVVKSDGSDMAPISLSLGGPSIAGSSIDSIAEDATTRMRLTNYVASGAYRKIQAELPLEQSSTWASSNTRLQLELQAPANATALSHFRNYTSADDLQGLKTLADNTGTKGAQDLVKGIQTAWSGTDANDGYVIRYVFTQVSFASEAQPVPSTTVTFTILADN